MSFHPYFSIVPLSLTSILLLPAPSSGQDARCIVGCSFLEEERAFREAGLELGECDVSVGLEIAPDGSVDEVVLLREDENRTCNETLVAYARKSRWSADSSGSIRRKTIGRSPGPGSGGEAEFHTYPGALGLDTGGYFLLTHHDPRIDLADLSRRFSLLGPFETIEEVRSDAPVLCAIGRDRDGDVVFRSGGLETLS
ncbi:MAG: hypothetical protein ACREK2_06985, partial [Gemmatimonadota bacterium]